MTTSKASHRSLVSLALPWAAAALITYTEQIVRAMTGNPSFASPSPTLAAVAQAVDDLRTAEAAALSRTEGAVQARNDNPLPRAPIETGRAGGPRRALRGGGGTSRRPAPHLLLAPPPPEEHLLAQRKAAESEPPRPLTRQRMPRTTSAS